MSDRFETIAASDFPITLAPAGYDFGEGDVFDTPALVLGDSGATALVVPGTREELLAIVDALRGQLSAAGDGVARTEIVVDRNPDGGANVRVWLDGREVTDDVTTNIVVVDPGAGWSREDWGRIVDDLDVPLTARPHAVLVDLQTSYVDSDFTNE